MVNIAPEVSLKADTETGEHLENVGKSIAKMSGKRRVSVGKDVGKDAGKDDKYVGMVQNQLRIPGTNRPPRSGRSS